MAINNSANIPSLVNTAVVGNSTSNGFTTIPYSAFPASGNNLVARDANGNTAVNSLAIGTTSIGSGGTTTLTIASTQAQIITGSSTSTVVLPDATTLYNGWTYLIHNQSTGLLTVNKNGGGLLTTVVAGAFLEVYLTDDTTSAGVWDTSFQMPSNAQYGTAGLNVTGFVQASNTVITGYATTATAAATTTLISTSKQQQYFTGTTTQTVALPVTSTLVLGQSFTIVNNSTGVVTVQSSGGNTIQAMAANTQLIVTCILTSGTTAASWNAEYTTQAPVAPTYTGDTGTPFSTNSVTIEANTAANGSGASVSFNASSPSLTLLLSDLNGNVLLGKEAGNATVSGPFNSSLGYGSLLSISSGGYNCALGYSALDTTQSGSYNIGIGQFTSDSQNGNENSTIMLNAYGLPGVSNALFIGAATGTGTQELNAAYIQGIYSNTQAPSGTVEYVTIDNTTGQLGVTTASGNVTFTGDSGTPFTTNTVTIYSNASGNNSGSTIKFNASSPNLTLNVTDTNSNTLFGLSAGNASVSGTVNSGYSSQSLTALTSGVGNSGYGARSLVAVTSGSYNLALGYGAGSAYVTDSSNISLNTAGSASESHTLRIGAGTGTGNQQLTTAFIHGIVGNTVSNPNVVTINTATGQLGVLAVPSGLITFSADTGASFNVSSVTFTTGFSTNAAGESVKFASNGSNTITLDLSDSSNNTFIGHSSGKAGVTGGNNTALGYQSLSSITSAPTSVAIGVQSLAACTTSPNNVAIGYQAMYSHTVGYSGDGSNVAIGYQAMQQDTTSVLNVMVGYQAGQLNNGSYGNTGVGYQALNALVTGEYNCCLGYFAGGNLDFNETGCTLINNQGVTGESHVVRIGGGTGTSNQLASTCYISGVANPALTAGSPTPYLMMQDISNDQLQALTPVQASAASSTFGSLAVGTALQNTANYPILVNVSVAVTAATTAVILVGVGSTNAPTAQAVTASFTVAAVTTYGFSFVVPAKYYAKVTTTGTITIGSITTLATQIG
jgi:hypothetical protein